MAVQTNYLVQTYVRGARGALKPDAHVPCRDETAARMRAERIMAAGRILGVDVVRQVVDATAGDYGEPEYLLRLGEVPSIG
jgi:hypothetical protein